MLLLLARSRCSVVGGVVALAQAAAGQVEEDVVEGRPGDLDPPDRRARPGEVADQPRRQLARRAATRIVTSCPARSTTPRRRSRATAARRPTAASSAVPKPRVTRSPSAGLEPRRGVVGDDQAVVDDDHPVGDRVGLLEVVGGQHDRGAVLRVQPLDLLLEVGPVLRVEAGRRLVEEQQPRRVHQADRDVEPAALAAGQGRDRAVGVLGEVERLDQLVGPAPRPPAGSARSARRLADQLVAAALGVPGGVALADVPDRCGVRRAARAPRRTRRPRRCPTVGAISVVSIRRVVDLPAPLGPRKATSSPRRTSRSRPRTASTVFLWRVKCLVESRGPDHRSLVCVAHGTTLGAH